MLARVAPFLGRPARRGAYKVGKPGEVLLAVEQQCIGLLIRQHVLAEDRAERGEAGIDVGEPRFRRRVKGRARTHESQVIALEHAPLFRGQREALAHLVQAIDPAEQGRVHENGVPVLGLEWRELTLDRQNRIVRMGAGQQVEDVAGPRERLSTRFERGDGVGEGRRGGIAGDGRHFGGMRGECAGKSFRKMIRSDPVERRHAERAYPFLEQRVVGSFSGGDFGLLIHAPHMGCERVHCTLSDEQGQSTSASLHS